MASGGRPDLVADCLQKYEEHALRVSKAGVVDKIKIPDNLPPGEYVLSWRWDCEQTPQVWGSCADVTIKAGGPATKPFSPMSGCEPCCAETLGFCANCTKCLNDKTGDCAYCWKDVSPRVVAGLLGSD